MANFIKSGLIALVLVPLLLAGCASNEQSAEDDFLWSSTATIDEQGTITLRLRSKEEGMTAANGLYQYPVGHPQYDYIAQHVGRLRVGQWKSVPPFE